MNFLKKYIRISHIYKLQLLIIILYLSGSVSITTYFYGCLRIVFRVRAPVGIVGSPKQNIFPTGESADEPIPVAGD